MRTYRQGDILLVEVAKDLAGSIQATRAIETRKRGQGIIVAAGEATGHHHRVRTRSARVRTVGRTRYLCVAKDGAELTHEEHKTIKVDPGVYEIRHQREYTPTAASRQTRVYD